MLAGDCCRAGGRGGLHPSLNKDAFFETEIHYTKVVVASLESPLTADGRGECCLVLSLLLSRCSSLNLRVSPSSLTAIHQNVEDVVREAGVTGRHRSQDRTSHRSLLLLRGPKPRTFPENESG